MREVELKSVVTDVPATRERLERAGARLVFAGRLEDRRYDTPARALAERDEVLRIRVYRDSSGVRAELGWKGPTERIDAYKVREELGARTAEPDEMGEILARLGFVVTRAIDREIAQYELDGAVLRFERYPRMDELLEVEGAPDAIERAIAAAGLPRAGFTSERLPAFVHRYEQRTGGRAALCDEELGGARRYRVDDA